MVEPAQLLRRRADALASELHLDLGSTRICLACLSIVAFELEGGSRHEVQGRLVTVTKDLWLEGLSEHALAAVEEAAHRGVPGTEAALADLQRLGGSPIARAITLRLAWQLLERARNTHSLTSIARDRLDRTWPELN
jgi:hypothetical protein